MGEGPTPANAKPLGVPGPFDRTPESGPLAASAYVHIPFCFHKCHYCDFYSFVDTQDRQGPFTDALLTEIEHHTPFMRTPLDTLFVGGGTPTLLAMQHWDRLLETLDRRGLVGPATEFTVECNPETASADLFDLLRAGGVNRLSIGAQSFNTAHLKTLERWHDPNNVERALKLARDAGIDRCSIDLIYAVPGQTLDDWDADLARASAFVREGLIEHVSAYALTYEPNTAMTARRDRGDFAETPEEIDIAMFERTAQVLADAGLARYEVSNYAKDGAACAHNLAYWRQHDWLAFGPSASGHFRGHRWKNAPRLSSWESAVCAGTPEDAWVDHEPPDAARALRECLMTGLRLAEGVDGEAMLAQAHTLGCLAALERAATRCAEKSMLALDAGRWRVTEAGWLFADGVAAELMGAIEPAPD